MSDAPPQFENNCPHCAKRYQFTAEKLGQEGTCDKCGKIIHFVPKLASEYDLQGPPEETRVDGIKHVIGGGIFMTVGGGGLAFAAGLLNSLLGAGAKEVRVPAIIPLILLGLTVVGLVQLAHGLRTILKPSNN